MKKTFAWESFLRKHVIFSGITEAQLKPLLQLLLRDEVSSERKYTQGSVLLEEGELGDSIFLLGLGSVQVTVRGTDGYETALSVLKQGEFFGEMALLDEKPRAATVRAKESCVVLEIKGEEFRHILQQYHEVEAKILLKLSERLRNTNEQLLSVRLTGMEEKLDQLNAKLNEETRIVDSRLQAAHAVFDQINTRANEVITSAERSRTRLAMAGTLLGTVVTALGWFGVQEFLNIRENIGKQATEARSTIKQLVNEANQSARALEGTVQEQASLLQETKQWLDKSKETFIEDIVWQKLYIAVSVGNPFGNVGSLYDSYKELRAFNYDHLVYLLRLIETHFSDPLNIHKAPPKYMELLLKIYQDIQSLEYKIKAYYLYLANAILTNPDEFEKMLPQFEAYVKKHPSVRIKKSDVDTLENFFAADLEKHRLFQHLRPLIPTE
jgi:CRP-like cAMP-binding protein